MKKYTFYLYLYAVILIIVLSIVLGLYISPLGLNVNQHLYIHLILIVLLITAIVELLFFLSYQFKSIIIPLKKFLPILHAVEKGDLSKKIDIKGQGLVVDISKLINRLIENLKLYTDQLEAMVEDRTRELKIKEFYIEHMHDGLCVIDIQNKIIAVNSAFMDMVGYKKEELIGRSIFSLFDEENQKILSSEFEKRSKGESSTYEISVTKKDQTIVPVIISGSPIIEDGVVVEKIGIFTDISFIKTIQQELELKNKELEKANKAKSDFLASMSHELRTPLNAIIGFSEILLERNFGNLTPKQEEYIKDILEAGEHLLLLINDILDLARVESGHMVLEPSEFYVKDIVEQSITMVKERALKHYINLSSSVSDNVTKLYADERKIKQILYNLLSNAIKFTPDNGNVSVSVNKADNEIIFSVEDTGIGIPEEAISKLFYPFSQIRLQHPSIHEGTGLGLSLVKTMVELHGGKIWVESRVGKGSKFTFTIPLNIKHSYSQQYDINIKKRGKCNYILIVEDDKSIAKLMSWYLQDAGYKVKVVGDGEQAISLAKGLKPDLITLNLSIPKKDGWLVLKSLKSDHETEDIPIIIISSIEEGKEALKLGASSFILKPVDRLTLLREIERVCGKE